MEEALTRWPRSETKCFDDVSWRERLKRSHDGAVHIHLAWRTKNRLQRVEGNWKQVKGKIKEKSGVLTDDDLTSINGKRDQLEGKIQDVMAYRRIKFEKT